MARKTYLLLFFSLILTDLCKAQSLAPTLQSGSFEQPQPFAFTINTLNLVARSWSLSYTGGYGQHTVTPLGFDGVDQNFSVKGYLGNRFTLYASMGTGFQSGGGVRTLQQAEVLRDFFGGNNTTGFRIGAGLGFRREFNNDKVAFSRITGMYDAQGWKFGANVRLEKAFDVNRDGLDIITSIGIHRHLAGQLFGGIEAVGQDLEGFWEADEAEGGARLLVGPSLNFVPNGSPFSFTLCGGPIIYATRSTVAPTETAGRELPSTNGFTVKFNVGFRFL